MRLGLQVSAAGQHLEAIVGQVRQAAAAGLDSAYFNQILSWDAISLAMLSAGQVPGIDVGTAVTLIYPRHPLALASQALTAQAASPNRFTLGIGPGHRPAGRSGWLHEPTLSDARRRCCVGTTWVRRPCSMSGMLRTG